MRGAVREDDVPWYVGGPLPADDPEPNFAPRPIRVLHHFYDPVFNRPLTVGGPLGERAPDWAENTGATPNYYAIPSAREAQFRALTGRDVTGSRALVPAGNGAGRAPNDPSEAEQMRLAYWATSFRAQRWC
jgi:hypothetical protein